VDEEDEGSGGTPTDDDSSNKIDMSSKAKELGLSKRGLRSRQTKTKTHKEKPTAQISKKKENRSWDTTKDVKNLDYSDKTRQAVEQVVDFTEESKVDESDDSDLEIEEEVEPIDIVLVRDGVAQIASKESGVLSSFWRGISVNVVGSNALTKQDIKGSLDSMKRKLMERNVAGEIAEKLCESVAQNLEGQKLKSFTGVKAAVVQAFAEALERVLTPKRSIDILADIERSRSRTKPYVIVFVGVNGVGKSTNLAKIAYWLLQNKNKVGFLSSSSPSGI